MQTFKYVRNVTTKSDNNVQEKEFESSLNSQGESLTPLWET